MWCPPKIDAGIVLRAAYTVLAGVFGMYGIVSGWWLALLMLVP